MTPSADDRDRARRRVLLQRHLLLVTRRSERRTASAAPDERPAGAQAPDRPSHR